MPAMPLFRTIRTWGEMIRFSHSVFALPFALMAAFLAGRKLAGGVPTFRHLLLIVLCMIAARSFAMTFNRLADAAIDARNPRTAGRALPTGRIDLVQAWIFLIACAAAFVGGCALFWAWFGNSWPLVLSLPVLALLGAYSHAKRFTPLAHFFLGSAIGLSPIAAWIAIHPASLGLPALLLGAAVLFWIGGFDIIYACQDVDIDRRDGLFSIPARWGVARALLASRSCHMATIAALAGLGGLAHLGWVYWSAAAVTAVLLAAEQSVVRPNDLSRVNLAFFTINGCVSILLGAATIVDVLMRP
jgi:4-hydroxybenzoate polyprenyltransferase